MNTDKAQDVHVQLLDGAHHKHLQKVREFLIDNDIHNEEIIAVWCVSPKNIKAASIGSTGAPMMLFMPCFWPHLCCLSPCLIAGYLAQKEMYKGTIYVLGRKNLYRISDVNIGNHNGSSLLSCFNCTTGRDSAMQELSGIQGISIDSRGEGFCAQLRTSHVSIGLPIGSPLVNSGRSGHESLQTQFVMLVEEPEKAARLIREAKEQQEQAQMNAMDQQQVYQPAQAVVAVPVNAMVMERPYSTAVENENVGDDNEKDIVTKLKQLKTLLDEELITTEDYHKKKAEILENM